MHNAIGKLDPAAVYDNNIFSVGHKLDKLKMPIAGMAGPDAALVHERA